MSGFFSVSDDLDFTDEEINLSILQAPIFKKGETVLNDSPFKSKDKDLETPKPKRFKSGGTQLSKADNFPFDSQALPKPSFNSIRNEDVLVDFFGDDEDDQILSQMDIPEQPSNLKENMNIEKKVEKNKPPNEDTNINTSKYVSKQGINHAQTNFQKSQNMISKTFQSNKTPIRTQQNDSFKELQGYTKQKTPVSCNVTPRQRKFPGPAGNLPELSSYKDLNTLKSPETLKIKKSLTPNTPKTPLQTIINMSQEQDSHSELWSEMRAYIKRKFPNERIHSIIDVVEKAGQKKLDNCKVPLLCGIIKSFTIVGNSGRVLLYDNSGDIHGAIHSDVLEEYQKGLQRGSGLILKDVSVFSPTLKKHYLNITPSNIAHFFEREIPEEPMTQFTQPDKNNKTIIVDSGVEK